MKKYYERTGDTRLRTADRSYVIVRVASKTAYDAWIRCIEARADSERAQGQPVRLALLSSGEDTVVVSVRWDKNASARQPKLLAIETEQLRCGSIRPQALTTEAVSFSCQWDSPFATRGVVIARTQRSGSPALLATRPKRQLTVSVDFKEPQEVVSGQREKCSAAVFAPANHQDHDGLDDVECHDGGDSCTGDGRWATQMVRLALTPNSGYKLAG
jgi:hypothetical protein